MLELVAATFLGGYEIPKSRSPLRLLPSLEVVAVAVAGNVKNGRPGIFH